MKSIEEIVNEKFGDDLSGYLYVTPNDLVSFYKETYNEAIDDAIKYVKIKEKSTRSNIEKTIQIYIIDKESLNKLKK